jgi:hypothetical protein
MHVGKVGSATQNVSVMIIADFGVSSQPACAASHQLATRWFERLLDLLPVGARDIFP